MGCMMDERTESVAQAAARLMVTGRCDDVRTAIAQAMEQRAHAGAARPGEGRVRQHIRAMTMQALGGAGYAASVRSVLERAEEIMTLLDEAFLDLVPVLAGRASKGLVDGDTTLHIRLYTEAPLPEIADVLESADVVGIVVDTIDTTGGRLNRLRFDDDGVPVHLVRCPRSWLSRAGTNLFNDQPIATATLDQLRARIATLDGDAD